MLNWHCQEFKNCQEFDDQLVNIHMTQKLKSTVKCEIFITKLIYTLDSTCQEQLVTSPWKKM